MHRRWLAGLSFEHAAHSFVLEDCIAAVEAATARRDHLEAHIEAALPDWSLTPVAKAPQALRGLALVAAAMLVAELGDITRFRQSAAVHGLSGSRSLRAFQRKHATPGQNHQGWQWRGTAHVDRGGMELPVSSTYRSRSPSAPRKVERQANPRHSLEGPGATFCRRYRKLAHAGKLKTVITAAIARELSGFRLGDRQTDATGNRVGRRS